MAQPVKLSEPRRIDKDPPRYDVVEAPTLDALAKKVERVLADGWACQGGFVYRAQDGFYLQAVVKQ